MFIALILIAIALAIIALGPGATRPRPRPTSSPHAPTPGYCGECETATKLTRAGRCQRCGSRAVTRVDEEVPVR